ncbi:hypothetical protein HD806DRAFT_524455 [Xylariaceae sp. AK1471]|nr:hypothetical protein HD806DRAFT_524455 [Xylariaceae sp. AK1471]
MSWTRSTQPPESYGDDLDFQIYTIEMGSASPSAPHSYDSLDDVFGPGPDESPIHDPLVSSAHDNPDISFDARRLQAQHTTVGYREGITTGKAASIQAGFDQGFALGANIGIRAGQILGLLEAISAALAEASPTDKSVHADSLLSRAATDLNPERVFTSDFWAPDGTWTYPVVASHEGDDIVYPDVADQHPLIAKWSRIARDEANRWHLDQSLPILESSGTSAQEDPAIATPPKPDSASRDAIEW